MLDRGCPGCRILMLLFLEVVGLNPVFPRPFSKTTLPSPLTTAIVPTHISPPKTHNRPPTPHHAVQGTYRSRFILKTLQKRLQQFPRISNLLSILPNHPNQTRPCSRLIQRI